jgi:hypothetical protein
VWIVEALETGSFAAEARGERVIGSEVCVQDLERDIESARDVRGAIDGSEATLGELGFDPIALVQGGAHKRQATRTRGRTAVTAERGVRFVEVGSACRTRHRLAS